jgi:hypothetical protein
MQACKQGGVNVVDAKGKMVMISFRVPVELYEAYRKLAFERHEKQGKYYNEALQRYLVAQGFNEKTKK